MEYGFTHNDKVFTPSGSDTGVDPEGVETHNKELERQEIESLKAHPEHVFLYVKEGLEAVYYDRARVWTRCEITTWLGTVLDDKALMGPKFSFSFGSTRRAIACTLFGVKYTGYYMVSSGSYCRLKRSKKAV